MQAREEMGSRAMSFTIVRDSFADYKTFVCLKFPAASCCFLLVHFSEELCYFNNHAILYNAKSI